MPFKDPERQREYERNRHQPSRWKDQSRKLREEVITAYGSKCVCCGEDESVFLVLDHINNDGAAHRKEIGKGGSMYRWIKRNGFPKDLFQILCWNCNAAKSILGRCPHSPLTALLGT